MKQLSNMKELSQMGKLVKILDELTTQLHLGLQIKYLKLMC